MPVSPPTPLRALVADFLDHLALERGLSDNTRKAYRRDLHHFTDWLAKSGHTRPANVGRGDILDYLFALRENGMATATLARRLSAIKGLFRHLAAEGILANDVTDVLESPRLWKTLPPVLSERDTAAMIAQPEAARDLDVRDTAMMEVLYGCGLRRGECLRLDLVDLDLGQQLVLVRNGKGKKDRLVPLTGQAVKALDLYLQESRPELLEDLREDALFLSKYGRRMGRTCLYLLLAKHARAARLRGAIYPHALRHSYATHLLKGRASVRHVQELLGHQSLQSTAVYTLVSVEDLRAVLARCHPRERLWRPGK